MCGVVLSRHLPAVTDFEELVCLSREGMICYQLFAHFIIVWNVEQLFLLCACGNHHQEQQHPAGSD